MKAHSLVAASRMWHLLAPAGPLLHNFLWHLLNQRKFILLAPVVSCGCKVHCLLETVKMRPLWLVPTFRWVCEDIAFRAGEEACLPIALAEHLSVGHLKRYKNNTFKSLWSTLSFFFFKFLLRVYSLSATFNFYSGPTERNEQCWH